MAQSDAFVVSDAVRESFQPVLQALPLIREAVAGQPDVVTVRPGYQYPANGDPVPSAVVATGGVSHSSLPFFAGQTRAS